MAGRTAYEINKDNSNKNRDIANDMPRCLDVANRNRCRESFRQFCETYHELKFPLAWSPDHITVLDRVQTCIQVGGQFALAMPRGSGKTTIALCAVEWALLYGYCRYVAFIGATETHAHELIASIRTDLETNDGLFEDFPEVCYPLRRIEGIAKRCAGQLYKGKPTCIEIKKNSLVLPTIEGSVSSGGRIKCAGITGRIRGFITTIRTGENLRPDLCIADDPSTDESARSFQQNNNREQTIKRTVMGLAGPGKKLALVIPCTVIEHDDLAQRLLDNGRNPEFQGETFELLYSFPTNTELWDQYSVIRSDDFRAKVKNPTARCNAFYVANRSAMDEGAKPGWVDRFYPDEVSAIQHCMNLYIADPKGFNAEYRNKPERQTGGITGELEIAQVVAKLTNGERTVVPPGTTRLTASIDVGSEIMYWSVAAWDESFNATTVDYGTYPPQGRPYFTSESANPKLSHEFTGAETARVYHGLEKTTNLVLGNIYGGVKVERCLIDSGKWADVVYKFCNQSPYSSILTPSKGYGIAASAKPMADWPKKENEKQGWNWRARRKTENQRGLLVLFDANAWKTKFREMVNAPKGAPGCWELFGDGKVNHELFIDHLRAEYPVETSGHGRTLLEWRLRLDKPNNHYLDTVIMTLVAGSYTGLSVTDVATAPLVANRNSETPERKPTAKRRRLSYNEVMAERAKLAR